MPPSVRTLDQIMGELGTIYDPQINSIRQRQSLIPEQIKQEEQGLQAKQENAFGDILGGARRRGLGFSGIPLGEQAKYTATEFLPALARLRQSGREQALSLEDAILGIQERRQNQALQLRQYEQSRLDAYESEQRQLAESRRQAAAAAAMPSFNVGNNSPAGAARPVDDTQQWAYNDVRTRIQGSANDTNALISDWLATARSAGYGNLADKYKLQIYAQLKPDLFGYDPLQGGRGVLKKNLGASSTQQPRPTSSQPYTSQGLTSSLPRVR